MKRFGSDDERRTHRVERQFLEIITRLFRENLINHESLVASPGSLQLPRGGEPEFGLTVHDVPVRRVSTSVCDDVSAHGTRCGCSVQKLNMAFQKEENSSEIWFGCPDEGWVVFKWSCAPRRIGVVLIERERKRTAI